MLEKITYVIDKLLYIAFMLFLLFAMYFLWVMGAEIIHEIHRGNNLGC